MVKDKLFFFLLFLLIILFFITSDLAEFFIEKTNEILVEHQEKDIIENDHISKIDPIYSKGIYITFRTAGSERIDEILELIKTTELNTVVIDLKDYTGRIPFDTDSKLIDEIGSEKIFIKDINELVKKFKDENIYLIARVAVFEDDYLPYTKPELALKKAGGGLWTDARGLAWLDPASEEVWDYIVEIARQAKKAGFDEINLDYIRFPTDGNISSIVYPFWDYTTPKKEVLKDFFEYISQRIKPMGLYLSADLFGLTMTSTNDLNIGQWLEYAAPYFDYICPMVYPSHYPDGYIGFQNPAAYPYEVVFNDLTIGLERLASVSSEAKLRPWLQDFDIGANYDAEMIDLQKQAVYNAGAHGWLFWNPKNIYTEEGFLKE